MDVRSGEAESFPQPFLAETGAPPNPALRSVFAVFSQMKASGITPDHAAFNALIDACASVGDVARAEGAFGALVAAGLTPDAISYTCLIKACTVADDAARAERVFSEMLQKSNHFSTFTPPSAHTFRHLMTVHGRAGSAERVLELFEQMHDFGLAPSGRCYRLALCAAAKNAAEPSSLARAEALYGEMRVAGHRLDTRTLLALDQLCALHGRTDLASRMRRERSISMAAPRMGQAQAPERHASDAAD